MARQAHAPYMTLPAANFFLKYAKDRGVSKVARGESKSTVTKIGFMQAYAKAKGDHKKLKTMMATPTQTWDERRNNFVARHMAQLDAHGEALYETSGKYKGWPTRRHLGLIMWAMTPDPRGVGNFIARQRTAATRMAHANSRYTSARRDDPELWERVKAEITRGTKGGKAGQWSARKAQFAVAEYQRRGGGYLGAKSPRNALAKWTREEWGTRSGRPSLVTGERYLPRAAREALTPAEYAATTRAKREGLRRGEQFTRQPGRIAKKTAKYRK
jgi:hypothetical protein